jgi:hypothetical protein
MKSQTTPTPLLVTRSSTKQLLCASTPGIYELEKAGLLTPVRLNPKSAVGKVHYRYEQVLAIANGASTLDKTDDAAKAKRKQRHAHARNMRVARPARLRQREQAKATRAERSARLK